MNIYELARTNLPQSWDVLANNPTYGEPLLQSKVDFIKYRLFATICNATVETTFYNPLEMNYAAKHVALQVIPVAIDYYKNVHNTVSTQGASQESVSYPDRVRALEKLGERFTKELVDLALELPVDAITNRKRSIAPKFNTGSYVTEDPANFPSKTIDFTVADTSVVISE